MDLPTVEEVQKLTMRAIAVYAARCARRATGLLRGSMDDDVIDPPLRMAEKLGLETELSRSDAASAARSSSRVVDAMTALSTPGQRIASLCLTRTAAVVQSVLNASSPTAPPDWARGQLVRASRAAAKIPLHLVHALNPSDISTAITAVRSDYEILLKLSGEHTGFVLGDPLELPEEWKPQNQPPRPKQ